MRAHPHQYTHSTCLHCTISDYAEPKDIMGVKVNVDQLMTQVGQAFFFPQFALFPVLYLDDGESWAVNGVCNSYAIIQLVRPAWLLLMTPQIGYIPAVAELAVFEFPPLKVSNCTSGTHTTSCSCEMQSGAK
jgi:hypothetical protein